MKPRTASRLAWSVAASALALYGAAMALAVLNVEQDRDILFSTAGIFVVTGYATVGALIASRRRENPIGWLFLLIAGGFGITGLAEDYAARAAVLPASLPGAEWAEWLGTWSVVVFIAPVPVVLLLFPDGRLPSSRWRPVLWGSVAGPAVVIVGIVIRPRVEGSAGPVPSPTGIDGADGVGTALMVLGGVATVVAALGCVAGLIVRVRRSRGEERQQIRLLAHVGAAAVLLLLATFASPSPVDEWTFIAFFASIGFGVPVASAVAILRYRLYALDLVLKRAVVFGILAAFITLAYFVIVIGIPTVFFGAGGGAQNLIPFLAAAALAIAFQPVRRAAARFADRLVYGRRKSPYEVLADFSDRMVGAWSAEDALPTMAEMVRAGVGASRAEVWVRVGPELRRGAVVPQDPRSTPMAVAADDLLGIADVDLAAPVRDRGEVIGALAVSMPRSAPLTLPQEQLVRDLAAQAGLVLRNVRLIEELRASRKRLVEAQDEERRRLERDVHDGAQQQLVALSVNLRLARSLAQNDPAKATEVLERLQGDAQQALEDLRDLARGIYPPLLADKGLLAALEAQARKSPLPVEVHPDGVGRYPPEAEAAVYFCVLEALQNAAKYAEASRVEVRLEAADDELRFEVTDDGQGFDPAATPPGSGLRNMRDRLEALGGMLSVASSSGGGTRVTGSLPTRAP